VFLWWRLEDPTILIAILYEISPVIMKAGKCHHQNKYNNSAISFGAPPKTPMPSITPKGIGTTTIVAGAKDGVNSKV
jgi:hypothetical protein